MILRPRYRPPIGGVGLDFGVKPPISFVRRRRQQQRYLSELACGREQYAALSVTIEGVDACEGSPFPIVGFTGINGTFSVPFYGVNPSPYYTVWHLGRFSIPPTSVGTVTIATDFGDFTLDIDIFVYCFPGIVFQVILDSAYVYNPFDGGTDGAIDLDTQTVFPNANFCGRGDPNGNFFGGTATIPLT